MPFSFVHKHKHFDETTLAISKVENSPFSIPSCSTLTLKHWYPSANLQGVTIRKIAPLQLNSFNLQISKRKIVSHRYFGTDRDNLSSQGPFDTVLGGKYSHMTNIMYDTGCV